MTLQIALSPDVEARLRERAAASGSDMAAYAASLLDRALRQQSLDELLAPVRKAVAESGMSDEELGELLERAKHDLRRERHRARR